MLLDAFDSNWVAPLWPHVDGFEQEMAERIGVRRAVARSSGTEALHLALKVLGVGAGDTVLVPTLTFAATSNAVIYVGAVPVFIGSWKPMHQQPVFSSSAIVGGGVSDDFFARGLCLPSGSAITSAQQGRVIDAVLKCRQSGGGVT